MVARRVRVTGAGGVDGCEVRRGGEKLGTRDGEGRAEVRLRGALKGRRAREGRRPSGGEGAVVRVAFAYWGAAHAAGCAWHEAGGAAPVGCRLWCQSLLPWGAHDTGGRCSPLVGSPLGKGSVLWGGAGRFRGYGDVCDCAPAELGHAQRCEAGWLRSSGAQGEAPGGSPALGRSPWPTCTGVRRGLGRLCGERGRGLPGRLRRGLSPLCFRGLLPLVRS